MKKFYLMLAALIVCVLSSALEANAMRGAYYVCGDFYTVSCQSDENPRAEAFSVETGTYSGSYGLFSENVGDSDNPFRLTAVNQSETVSFVYLNNVRVENSEQAEGNHMFQQLLTLGDNDVVKVFAAEPFTTSVSFECAQGSLSDIPDALNIVMDCVKNINPAETYNVLQGTKFEVSANYGVLTSLQVNGVGIDAVDGVYTFYADSEEPLVVTVNASAEGMLYVNGTYYTFSAASAENARVAAFNIEYGNYDGIYRPFAFNTLMNPYDLKGQNPENSFFVYVNNEKVEATDEAEQHQMFEAQVNLEPGCVVKIFDAEPYWTNMGIGFMQTPSQVADKVKVTMDEISTVEGLDQDNAVYRVLEGTKIEVRPVDGAQIKAVYYCNEDVEPVDGVYTVYADRAGDALLIIDMDEVVSGMAYIDGSFYTVSAQSDANNRNAAFDFTYQEAGYQGEYRAFNVAASWNPFTLRAQNESKSYFIYKNNEAIENEMPGGNDNGFQAPLTLAAGDVIKIYAEEPFMTNVTIGFKEDAAEASQNVEVTMDEITPVENLENGESFRVLKGTKFQVKAKEGSFISGVTVGDVAVEAEAGVYTFYANSAEDMTVTINMTVVEEGVVMVNGKFYTVSAQSSLNNRVQPIEFEAGEYVNEYRLFHFDAEMNPFDIKAQNQQNSSEIFAYLNNEPLQNSETGTMANMFDSQVYLNGGDVLKIYDAHPYWTNMGIGFFQDPQKVFEQVVVTMDEILPVQGLEADNAVYRVLQGTKFEIRAAEGARINAVYYCNEDVEPVDGVYTVYADREGDALVVIDMVEMVNGMVYLDADVYNFSIQSDANPRDAAAEFSCNNYDGTYRAFSVVASANPFNIKGQTLNGELYVYKNNEEVENSERGVMAEMFDATVVLEENDVIKAFDKKPYWTNMGIGFFQNPEIAADKVEVTMDEIIPVEGLEADNAVYRVLQGTKFQIRATGDAKINAVYYCNEDVTAVDGIYTVYADREGDALVVIDVEMDGNSVDGISGADTTTIGTVYNMQGIAVLKNADAKKIATLPAGLYIFNGKKFVVR